MSRLVGDANNTIVPQTLLPNFGDWKKSDKQEYNRGLLCDVYTYEFAVGSKTNSVRFLLDRLTRAGWTREFARDCMEKSVDFRLHVPLASLETYGCLGLGACSPLCPSPGSWHTLPIRTLPTLISLYPPRFPQYVFYVDAANKLPISFQMLGYDELLGSHYDSYIITYYTFESNANMPDSLFTPPQGLQCGDFPGRCDVLPLPAAPTGAHVRRSCTCLLKKAQAMAATAVAASL